MFRRRRVYMEMSFNEVRCFLNALVLARPRHQFWKISYVVHLALSTRYSETRPIET